MHRHNVLALFVAIVIIALISPAVVAQTPNPGDAVDLAAFAHWRTWDGAAGLEWDEPRDIRRVEVDFANSTDATPAANAQLQYWLDKWPQAHAGGWTTVDTPWQGKWQTVTAGRQIEANRVRFTFEPLTLAEDANLRNLLKGEGSADPPPEDVAPRFRRTLKLRLYSPGTSVRYQAIHAYGDSYWNRREINIESGCGGKPAFPITIRAYNAYVLSTVSQTTGDCSATPNNAVRATVLYTEHLPDSNDRSIVTISGGAYEFGLAIDDILQRKSVFVAPLGVFAADATAQVSYTSYLHSPMWTPGNDIISRTLAAPEQDLTRATAEIPALSDMARSGRHPLRYIPLGWTSSREKYGLDYNGNVFINKHSAKAMKEDLARMLWEGDELYLRIGTGDTPDFREREGSASQSLQASDLPLVITRWQHDGIGYEERAYATLLDAPLDDQRLRGDEPSVLLLRLTASNPGARTMPTRVWLHVSPAETLALEGNQLLATGNATGAGQQTYASPRLRAVLHSRTGSLALHALPPASKYQGQAILWTVDLPAAGSQTLDITIPFRTFQQPQDRAHVAGIGYGYRLQPSLLYWSDLLNRGMQIHVPDDEFNHFYRTVLQHIAMSIQRDVKTGLDICPCGTYDYGLFGNETDIQVRQLDERNLPDLAWRCLHPLIQLQGSKPFPGRFRDTSAEFHGARVDADHDYTMSGYNTNHGWTLWTLAEHYLYTRDRSWLQSVLPNMIKAADWIVNERQATMQHESDGSPVPEYGLLPAGQLEDNEDWAYWFAVNGYAYRGLKTAAASVAAVDARKGAELQQQAQAYRQDIRRALFHAMAIAPAVPLRDGSFVPYVPPRASLHGRDLGWIRDNLYGAATLIDCGVLDANEPLSTWILQDYEDNLFMAEDSLSVPDRDWFSRGGIALQPNLVNTSDNYLERDQLAPALRALYNSFTASYYPDVAEFTEWVPTFGISGGPFFKTSDEAAFLNHLRATLVRESGNDLYLASGVPLEWFRPGRVISIQQAATFFGPIGYRVESHSDQHVILAQINLPQREQPQHVWLRLRDPDGKRMTAVEIDSQPWTRFNPEKSLIELPQTGRQINVRASFAP